MTEVNRNELSGKIEELITVLQRQQHEPKVDLKDQAWSTDQCAAYLKVSKQKFSRDIACNPSFPKARNLDKETSSLKNKRWIAADVINWFKAQKVH